MLKKNLLEEVSRLSGQTLLVVRQVHAATKSATLAALAEGSSVMLLGIGKIRSAHRGSKKARNIRTGEVVTVPARQVPLFRASDAVHAALNPAPV